MPTKTEQADLLMALFGRHGEAPMPIIAAQSPGDCFYAAMEAMKIAVKWMTPVMLLTDGYLANGSEPFRIPDPKDLPKVEPKYQTTANYQGQYMPYLRDDKLIRPWAVPGTPGLEHRIGGLEKEDVTGNISYDPKNHDHMVRLRAEKVARIAADIPPIEVHGEASGELLVLGWGSTAGAITGAVQSARRRGLSVSRAHLRYLNPFPANLGEVLSRFQKVLVPEMNLGQLAFLLRGTFLKDVITYSKVQGLPFTRQQIFDKILEIMEPSSNVH
jgi:2-oxoglutarate ferredoxin oxidoreductase subunit alpha